jgi:hypothetical protein
VEPTNNITDEFILESNLMHSLKASVDFAQVEEVPLRLPGSDHVRATSLKSKALYDRVEPVRLEGPLKAMDRLAGSPNKLKLGSRSNPQEDD